MRFPSGVTDQYLYFIAVDATDLVTRETGLASFTVRRSRNGAASAAYTTPTVNETDVTNMPGVYELLLDEDMTLDAGDQSQEVCLHITHAGMAPVTLTFELYRPSVTAGETLTVASGVGSANAVQVSGDSTAADNLETAFDDTAGAVPWQLISDQGTLQSVTNTTTVVLRAAASAEDDVYIGHTIHFVSGTTGVKQSALVSDYVGATKTVTLATAVPVALTGTVVYKIIATAPSPTNADITAILADTNELQTDWANGGRLDLIVDAILVDTGTTLDGRIPAALVGGRMDCTIDGTGMEAGAVTAVQNGLATAANLATVDTVVDAIQAQTDKFANLPVLTAGGTGGQGYGAP
jgi:hypothetical protein